MILNHKLQKNNYLLYLAHKEWFYLLAFSGMRVGEMCALKWTDINFEENTIRITKTLDMPDHNMRKFKLTPPGFNPRHRVRRRHTGDAESA